jgi:hypothetical protein
MPRSIGAVRGVPTISFASVLNAMDSSNEDPKENTTRVSKLRACPKVRARRAPGNRNRTKLLMTMAGVTRYRRAA